MKNKNKDGFTLIEVLISVMILSFVIVSILHAFAQRIHSDRNNNFKNNAITLAEAKLEEYLKFPSNRITTALPANAVEYIIYRESTKPVILGNDPRRNQQYRRTVEVTEDGNLATIRVTVDYGYIPRSNHYPFSVTLTTQRGL